MVLGSRLGSALHMVGVLVLGIACSAGGLRPRKDAAPAGAGGSTATGGTVGLGGAMATGGSSGTLTTLGMGGAPVDAILADAPPPSDASYPLVDGPSGLAVIDPQYVWDHFDELVLGTWLIGWYGGYDHFSWIRITSPTNDPFDGKLAVLAEPSIPTGVPYWGCNGSASWGVTQKPQTLDLRLEPLGCYREIMTFDTFRPVSWPGSAFMEASISALMMVDGGYAPASDLTGLKFPDDVCDAAFTACNAGF
jgi:hypothetical protein